MDITPIFNELLRKHNAPPVIEKKLSLEAIDGFLKEAYRINSHITTLHKELKDVRQAYLSTAQPRRHVRTNTGSSSLKEPQQPLTDRQREDIDARAKSMLRELNASIRALDETEQLRRETEAAVIRKTHVRGLGALGAWAAGAEVAEARKSAEHVAAEGKARDVGLHRDGVLWGLRQALQLCGRTQQDMMEARLTREMEKNRSVLAKAGGGAMPELGGGFYEAMKREKEAKRGGGFSTTTGLPPDEGGSYDFRQDLTEEQIQMFEKGNQDMLQHYNSTLDKVRTAEKSLIEIAELQTLLVGNLATQSAHIEQLVSDSENITADVGGGNKQLKKATQRPSAARYTFFASAGLCAFLILWDLVI